MFIDIILKKTHIVNPYVCPLQTISMFSTILHIQQKKTPLIFKNKNEKTMFIDII
jgi:hypothetical protein